jgi:transitional endoplasmic reticulum ATPase
MIAKAAACQTGAGFLSLRISDVVRGEVGRGEQVVREALRAARRARPCVVFIDEFQALFTARGGGREGGGGGRLATQLLVSMDELRLGGGEGGREGGFVSVLAATNAPEAIDPAFLRPGRFDKLVYVSLPDQKERLEIFRGLKGRMVWEEEEGGREEEVAERTEGFSGADMANLVRRAALHALARQQQQSSSSSGGMALPLPPSLPLPPLSPPAIGWKDVEQALLSCRPTTSKESLEKFRAFDRVHGQK